MAVLLDTHAAIWYFSNSDQLSPDALNAIDNARNLSQDVFLSAISLVEVIYLVEKGRLPAAALKKLQDALRDPESSMVVAPLDSGVAEAVARISRNTVPDMPDRIIAATAAHLGVPLVYARSAHTVGRDQHRLVTQVFSALEERWRHHT